MAVLDDRVSALVAAINGLNASSPELWELIQNLALTRLANAETSGGSGGITQTQVKNAVIAAMLEAKTLVTEFSLPPLTVADTATSEVEYTGYRFGIATINVASIGTSVTFADLASDVANYDILGNALVWRQASDVDDRIVRGLVGGFPDREVVARNTGSSRIILAHEDALATDINRFTVIGGRNFLWYPQQTIILAYISPRWRIAGTHYQKRVSTPTQITADQDDYFATDVVTGFNAFHSDELRLSTDAFRVIRGLRGGYDGRELRVVNVGTFDFQLGDEISTSVAGNRFAFGGNNLVVQPGQVVDLFYDGNASRWRSPESFLGLTRIRKTADESRTSTTTNSNDLHLATPSLVANTDYYLRCFLSVTGTSATGGIKGQWNTPAGASVCGNWTASTATANVNQPTSANVTLSTAANQDALQTHVFEGIIRIAGTAGAVQWSWSQATSAASAVTIKAGSFIEVKRL